MKVSNSQKFRLKAMCAVTFLAVGAFSFGKGIFQPTTLKAASSGPTSPLSSAPGEANCSICHSDFPINSGAGSVTISGLPANYRPNQTIPVTVTVRQPSASVYGFAISSLNNQNLQAGNPVLTNTVQTRTYNGTVSGNQRRYVSHTSDGILTNQVDTKTWSYNWVAPATRAGRVTFYATGNGANNDGAPSGDYIYSTKNAICSGVTRSNFDLDSKAEIAVYRPSNGTWYRTNSTDNSFVGYQFGLSTDKPVPADYDGDGRTDYAVWRASNGTFYYIRSSDGSFAGFGWGTNGDIPFASDYDGDGKADFGVFRPSTGTWFVNQTGGGVATVQWGTNGDKPLPLDFDGDGKSDFAVYRPSNGTWYILQSATNSFVGYQFGNSTDRPVAADYDGDGKADIAVYRPSNGTWYLQRSTQGFLAYQFGLSTDVPSPADYDGDCLTDIAVYRAGNWFILNSADNSVRAVNFGLADDKPVPTAAIPE